MGMPITVEILDDNTTQADIERVFAYFRSIDDTFSTYKEESEISKINRDLDRLRSMLLELKSRVHFCGGHKTNRPD